MARELDRVRVLLACVLALPAVAVAESKWPAVPEADLSKLKVADFADDELDERHEVPYLLKHFARVANAVTESGPERGFLTIAVNRDPKDNKPYNARIQEMNQALSYFYTTKSPWNPYYGSEAVKVRLEAMLEFWPRTQDPSTGFFSEYSPTNYSLAPTGFGVMSMSRTLERVTTPGNPTIDPGVLERTLATQRKAIMALLTRDEPYRWGRDWSNQWSGVIRAALAYLKIKPDDAEMRTALAAGVRRAVREFQSPLGFLYEAGGPDFGYSSVHTNNIRLALPLLRNEKDLLDIVIKEEDEYVRWLSYNYLRQPGTADFFTNAGVNTRTSHALHLPGKQPVSEFSEPARALSETDAERDARIKARRAALERDWPKVRDLAVPNAYAYNPGDTYLASDGALEWAPTTGQREAAISGFPYLKDKTFTRLAHDPRENFNFLYVRRPAYYAVLNAGKIRVPGRQSYGPGVFWTDAGGTWLQSVAATDFTWGTVKAGQKDVVEKKTFDATITAGGRKAAKTSGYTDLLAGDVSAEYTSDGVKKAVSFDATGMSVTTETPGDFAELLPLVLMPGDEVTATKESVRVKRGAQTLTITLEGATAATAATAVPVVREREYRRQLITVTARDRLKYRVTVTGG